MSLNVAAKKIVAHVILDRTKLRTPRRNLRKKYGTVSAAYTISAVLGRKGEAGHVKAVHTFMLEQSRIL
jgi:hypothetical protein